MFGRAVINIQNYGSISQPGVPTEAPVQERRCPSATRKIFIVVGVFAMLGALFTYLYSGSCAPGEQWVQKGYFCICDSTNNTLALPCSSSRFF